MDVQQTDVGSTSATASSATPTTTPPLNHAPDAAAIGDAGGATTVTALADEVAFTLTVGQAIDRMAAARIKLPSIRSMQRYCVEGRLAAQKIRTSNGSEWLINERSLQTLIDTEPKISGDAGGANIAATASSATPTTTPPLNHAPDAAAIGDAGGASDDRLSPPGGERRTFTDLLIENAKLVAQIEGKEEIITVLREDRDFLREEVREARRTRDDVKNIAERMLDTLKTMVLGRLAASTSPPEQARATIVGDDLP